MEDTVDDAIGSEHNFVCVPKALLLLLLSSVGLIFLIVVDFVREEFLEAGKVAIGATGNFGNWSVLGEAGISCAPVVKVSC